jgi:hypothetical protein
LRTRVFTGGNRVPRIVTTDGLATLHFDHGTWDLWVDLKPENTTATRAEVLALAGKEGCYVMWDEATPEHLEDGSVRHFLAYLEVAECP